MAETKPLRVGDAAPDFSLTSATGAEVHLSDYRDRSEVVLFFYPRNNTPVCTAESCSFRDSYEAFRDAGAEVIGVSTDTPESHRQFGAKHRLPFVQLSDPGGAVRSIYGVPSTIGLFPGRTTFVIDRRGIVRHVFSSQFRAARHVSEALNVLQALRGGEASANG